MGVKTMTDDIHPALLDRTERIKRLVRGDYGLAALSCNDVEYLICEIERLRAIHADQAADETTAHELSAEWTPCQKLPVVVHVREQRPGETHVSTREGITPVREDDLIMRGVQGEEYPIGRELFNKTYRIVTEAVATAAQAVADDVVLMPKIPTPEIIAAGWFDGDVTVALGHAQAYAESERFYISMLAAHQKEVPSC